MRPLIALLAAVVVSYRAWNCCNVVLLTEQVEHSKTWKADSVRFYVSGWSFNEAGKRAWETRRIGAVEWKTWLAGPPDCCEQVYPKPKAKQ